MYPLHVVTGAFGFTGRYIAARLLGRGLRVRTLTNSAGRASKTPESVEAQPFSFDQPQRLVDSLRGTEVLYNTYWVRFNSNEFRHSEAVQNTLILFQAAREAGVSRIVHVSVTNPSEESPFEYFRGKAVLEKALRDSGISYAILRPALMFGPGDILVNNIAWMLRKFPVFGVFGSGDYRVRPIYVDDLAALAEDAGQARQDVTVNAVGPETFTYRNMVANIGSAIGKVRPILSIPPALGYAVGWAVGKCLDDVVVTRPEIEALMSDLLYVDTVPNGTTALSGWLREHAETLGVRYANELARRNRS